MTTLNTPPAGRRARRYRRGPLTLIRTVVPLRPAGEPADRDESDVLTALADATGVLRDGPFGGDAA